MKTSRMNAPCHKCEERHVGCHAVCERYIKWRYEHIIKPNIVEKGEKARRKTADDYQIREMIKNKRGR